MNNTVLTWLLESSEPWTRYRTLVDLFGLERSDPEVESAHRQMVGHPKVRGLITLAVTWEDRVLKRHRDASHPLYALSTLADFGVGMSDPGMAEAISTVLAHQSPEGAFQTFVFIPRAFGDPDADLWTWITCDAPTLLYTLLAVGIKENMQVEKATTHLKELVYENGYRCTASPDLGKFKGPGRRGDPCPVANVYALKALSLMKEGTDSQATRRAAEMLLSHWDLRKEKKYFLFAMGTDFCKLKYPFVWFDILHVAEVLSRFSFVHRDARFAEMLEILTSQADEYGRYRPTSMYRAWKDWSFADKKEPSPWMTFLVQRILKRIEDTISAPA